MGPYNEKMVLKEYFDYAKSEEATIVYITKNLVDSLNTKNKWIDVVSFDRYSSKGGKFAFNYMIVELFERKIQPNYPKSASINIKKAITWRTAHDDILKQRSNGIRGTMYLITCKLINKNRGKKEIRLLPYWNEEYGGFDYTGRVPTTTISREFDMEPAWHYIITGKQKINLQQFNTIQEHYTNKIYPRIINEKFAKIDWFLETYTKKRK